MKTPQEKQIEAYVETIAELNREVKKLRDIIKLQNLKIFKFLVKESKIKRIIINYLFTKKTNWIDVGMFNHDGRYKLIQMRINTKNNKKEFRRVSLGWVNDYTAKQDIFKNTLNNNI